MRNFRLTKVLLVVIVLLGGLYLIFPEYLRNVIVYQGPDVDDHRIFDNRTVISGAFDPWEVEKGFKSKTVPLEYADIVNELKTHALLIAHDKKIIFEEYWQGYSGESRSNSFEMANSIISLLVGIAVDQCSIDSLDQAVGDFIPDFTRGDKTKITVRHLLEMRSGLNWEDSYDKPLSVSAKAYYGKDLGLLALNQDVVKGAGQEFEYMNGNTQLLALVLENATGMSLSAYASQKLWKQFGAGQDALWSLDQVNGVEKAFSCFSSNARDFARLGQLVLNDGLWRDKRIVSSKYLREALSPVSKLSNQGVSSVDYYGLNWWITRHKGFEVFYMKGYKGQYIIVVPEKDLLIVRLGSKSKDDKGNPGVPGEISMWLEIALKVAG